MAKQITFEYEDRKYTLEFNRASIQTMERQGFIASEITDKPMTTLPALFAGAVIMHHRNVANNRKFIEEIYDRFENKTDLIAKLSEMYQEPIMTLVEDPDEGDTGNIKWGDRKSVV